MLKFQSPRFAHDDFLKEILNDPDTGQKKLQPGSPPDSVIPLQQALFDLGWTLQIDPPVEDPSEFVIGIYGPKTTATVLAYKTHNNIYFPPTGHIDGLAGPRTFRMLDPHCVSFDASVAAIEAKATQLRAEGNDVRFEGIPPRTLPVIGTFTAQRGIYINGKPGAIYHNPKLGAFEIHYAIWAEYTSLGGPAGSLGSPISDVYPESEGFFRSDFERGSLRLDAATALVALVT